MEQQGECEGEQRGEHGVPACRALVERGERKPPEQHHQRDVHSEAELECQQEREVKAGSFPRMCDADGAERPQAREDASDGEAEAGSLALEQVRQSDGDKGDEGGQRRVHPRDQTVDRVGGSRRGKGSLCPEAKVEQRGPVQRSADDEGPAEPGGAGSTGG